MRATHLVRLDANYSFTDARNRSPGATDGNPLPRRAAHVANATVGIAPLAGLDLSTTVSLVGDSFDDIANRTRLDGYAVVDLRARYRLSSRLEVFGRVENLFDARYQTVFRYGQPGRGAFAGIRASL
jgi:vitamin B12 transporter